MCPRTKAQTHQKCRLYRTKKIKNNKFKFQKASDNPSTNCASTKEPAREKQKLLNNIQFHHCANTKEIIKKNPKNLKNPALSRNQEREALLLHEFLENLKNQKLLQKFQHNSRNDYSPKIKNLKNIYPVLKNPTWPLIGQYFST